MLASMTGYGRGEAELESFHFLVEIRSTNHRFCDFVIRLPKEMQMLEEKVRSRVKEKISRGRMDINIRVDNNAQAHKKIEVDEQVAEAYYKAIKRLQRKFQMTDSSFGVEQLVLLPDVLRVEDEQIDPEFLWPGVKKALDDAIYNLKEERSKEGSRIKGDLVSRLKQVDILVKECEERSPVVVENYCKRLHKRLQELLEGALDIDENRLIMESAIFAERSNITEEVVRLKSHLAAFLEALDKGGPVGRKLDFILQEMLREINTIGSKGNDYDIARRVVDVKSELEKMREQVQNIE